MQEPIIHTAPQSSWEQPWLPVFNNFQTLKPWDISSLHIHRHHNSYTKAVHRSLNNHAIHIHRKVHLPGHSHSTSAFVYHHDLSGENGILRVLFHSTIRQREFKKAIPWFPVALMVSVQCCLWATLPFVWCVLPHYNERFLPRPFDISKPFNGTVYWYPRQEKAHFPNSKLVQQIREVIFFIADLFQASQNKTFLRCWLWFMFVNDLKSQKNGMRHQTIMAYFLLYGKSLLVTDIWKTLLNACF